MCIRAVATANRVPPPWVTGVPQEGAPPVLVDQYGGHPEAGYTPPRGGAPLLPIDVCFQAIVLSTMLESITARALDSLLSSYDILRSCGLAVLRSCVVDTKTA
jgi:hypothetical protein